MDEGLVSVVIPIYNVEKYLDRCVKSVVNQSYRNLEIILVDDGSPDGCPQKCDEWAKKDNRIKVVHKQNAGLGMARNTGIENATGKYICFFDSDDYVALDTVRKCYERAEKEKADIITFGFCNVRDDGITGKSVIPHTDKQTYRGSEIQEIFLPDLIAPDTATGKSTGLWMSAWDSFYSMNLIRRASWRFVSERVVISEDVYSLLHLYKEVRCVSILPEALYFYCENRGSLTHTYREDRYEKIKHFYNSCIAAADAMGYGLEVKIRLVYPFTSNTIAALKMIVNSNLTNRKKITAFRSIVTDKQLKQAIEQVNISREKFTRKVLLKTIQYNLCWIAYGLVYLKRRQ